MQENSLTRDFAVLYVDDEEKSLKYFERALSAEMPVLTATSVEDALAILERKGHEIGVLITDQRMPGLTGVELLRRVRSDWPNIVRLLTTAYADLDDAIDAVNRGEIFRYITKPWEMRQLWAELQQAMDLFQLKRERELLLEEKLSVWQRLVDVNRVRDLVIMANALPRLRNAPAAVAAYLEASVDTPARDNLSAPAELDLWGLTEQEIERALAITEELKRLTADASGRFDTEVMAEELIAEATPPGVSIALRIASDLPPLRVDARAAQQLLGCLIAAAARSAQQAALTCTAVDNGNAVAFEFPLGTAQIRAADPHAPAQALAIYLLAYHHGGRVELATEDVRLTLPHDPTLAAPPAAPADWLARTLARLEGAS